MELPEFQPAVADLDADGEDRYQLGWGVSVYTPGRIYVHLAPGGEERAKQLHERHGSKLALSVGLFPYPWDEAAARRVRCPVLPEPKGADRLRLVASTAGAPFDANTDDVTTAALFNGRGAPVEFFTGTVQEAYLLERGTNRVVGTASNGARTLAARTFVIGSGESATLAVHVGTASCRPEHGYRLPSGVYDLVVVADGEIGYTAHHNGISITIVSDPVPVRINRGD